MGRERWPIRPWWGFRQVPTNDTSTWATSWVWQDPVQKDEISSYGDIYILLMVTKQPRKRRQPLQRCPGQQMWKSYKASWECNFLSKFSPRLADLSNDLHQLTCKGVPYNLGPEHTKAFNALKKELTSAPVLQYYDPKKPLVPQTDASLKGLSAVLLQESQPVYFTSKALSPCQWSFAVLQLEAPTVGWAVEKFHHFLYE